MPAAYEPLAARIFDFLDTWGYINTTLVGDEDDGGAGDGGSAAADDGVDLVVLSGYRSIALQKSLFFDVKSARNQTASERARVSAPPGYSEHATGFAIDLGDGSQPGANLSQSFEQTEAFSWLRANGARYQFVLSFPHGNSQGVSYEPWHWRYEGTTQALQVFEPAQRLSRP